MSSFQANRAPEPRVVHEIRIGPVVVDVVEELTREGPPTHKVVVRRMDEGRSPSPELVLRRDDLLLVARALDQAHAFVCKAGQRSGCAG
jgi:hypothetical protein